MPNINYYDPSVFLQLPQDVQQGILNSLPVAKRQTFIQTVMQFQQGQPSTAYQDPVGQLLNNLLGSGLFSDSSGGSSGGGHGGGGGGGSAGPSKAQLDNAGKQLGLSRDQLSLANTQLDSGYGQSLAKLLSDLGYAKKGYANQQAGLDLQKLMGQQNYAQQQYQLQGQSAARGSNTTAGIGHQFGQLGQQFADLMKQYGLQQTGLTQQEQQTQDQYNMQKKATDLDYFFNKQGNLQQQQGLNLQAGAGGYNDPFAGIPGVNPVPYTGKVR